MWWIHLATKKFGIIVKTPKTWVSVNCFKISAPFFYTHVLKAADRKAAEKIESLLIGGKSEAKEKQA